MSCLFAILLSFTLGLCLVNTAMAELPSEIRKLFEEQFEGEWDSVTTWGNQRLQGHNSVSWNVGGMSLSGKGTMTDASGVAHVTELVGWDATSNSIVFQGFDSQGNSWTIRYPKPAGGNITEWTGVGSGTYAGKKWESPTKLTFSKDGFRYEDTTDGKPFISIGTRTKPVSTPVNAQLSGLDWKLGSWTAIGTLFDGKAFKGKIVWERALDGNFLSCKLTSHTDRAEVIEAEMIVGWDLESKRIVGWEFWRDGYRGTFQVNADGTVFEGQGRDANGKQTFTSKLNVSADKKSYSYRADVALEQNEKRVVLLECKKD